MLEKAQKSKKQFIGQIKEFFPELEEEDSEIDGWISDFELRVERSFENYPTQQIEYQSKNRFTSAEGDPSWVYTGKFLKNIAYKFSVTPRVMANKIRKARNKKSKPLNFWRHKIPERNLNKWFYKYELAEALIPYSEETYELLLEQLKIAFNSQDRQDRDIITTYLKSADLGSIDKAEEQEEQEKYQGTEGKEELNGPDSEENGDQLNVESLDVDKLAKVNSEPVETKIVEHALQESKPPKAKHLIEGIEALLKDISEKYSTTRDKVGTFELPFSRFNDSRLERRGKKVRSKYLKSIRTWSNAHEIVLQDWKLNLDLFHAVYTNLIYLADLKGVMAEKISALEDARDEIVSYFKTIRNGLSGARINRSDLRKFIVQTRNNYKKEFKIQKARPYADSSISHNFPTLLDRLEVSIKSVISSLPEKCSVIKEPEVNGPLQDSEIFQISPSELIFFESFKKLQSGLKKGKLDLLKKSGESRIALEGLNNIIEFSLDSALDILDDQEKEANEAFKLVMDAIDRATSKLNEINDQTFEMINQLKKLVESVLREFNARLYELTNNENINDLKFRLTKAKAAARTSAFGNKTFQRLASGIDKATILSLKLIKKIISWFNRQNSHFSKRISAVPISAKVSDFLAESENQIQKLPFIYQRLFGPEPVSDQRMFVGRQDELQMFTDSFSKWEQGKFAATIVLSEKGAGVTSLLNYFIGKQSRSYTLVRLTSTTRISQLSDLIALFASTLGITLDSEAEIIEKLNLYERKRIIILEDLQLFFLRKVNGFESLKALQRIISATNDNIFWIVNTTLYTWEYLHNAINIGEVFEYQINLSDMSVDQITEIIINRNNISGYNIIFEVPDEDKKNKKLEKLDREQIQAIYSKNYFSNLNKFTRSNISLSLLYWLLSVNEVTEDTITVKSFKAPDFGFLSALKKTKIFVLQASIIHDGLNISELSEVLSISENESTLILLSLFEDGILMKRGEDTYIVNPLIFRQTVNFLKSQNLLI